MASSAMNLGYGYGWKLQAGSILPVYSDWLTIHHYVFTDAAAQNTVWIRTPTACGLRRKASTPPTTPARSASISPTARFGLRRSLGGTEEDAGTLYPTPVPGHQRQSDLLRYGAASGLPWTGSSARIVQVEDVRAGGTPRQPTIFTYNTDTIPH